LVRGGWRFEDDARGPVGRPFPAFGLRTPLVVLDSLSVVPGAGGDPSAFRSGLVTVSPAVPPRSGKPEPRSVFGYVNGDFGQDETVLSGERADSRNHLRIDAVNVHRDSIGGYDLSGRHLWSVAIGRKFGPHEISGTLRQAGEAERLQGGEEQMARGAAGSLSHEWRRDRWHALTTLSRQWVESESFGGTLEPRTRRDAQEVRVRTAADRGTPVRRMGASLDWSRAQVGRNGASAYLNRSNEVWVGTWWRDAVPGRTTLLELGGGHNGGVDRLEMAPRARVDWTRPHGRLSLWGARVLEPVWHDLAPGERGFLQNTWAVGAEAGGDSDRGTATLSVLAGRTRDRVLLARLPLEEQWLRAGQTRDPDPWNFALISANGATRLGPIGIGAEGVTVLRDRNARQARVDPEATGRGWVSWAFRAFTGDLGVRLRLEAEGIGPRVTDEAVPQELAGYVSGGFMARGTIGDASMTLRVRNLEDIRRPDIWIDRYTGRPALGPGRELRLSLGWKLRN
jgi:hypothetical protein